MAATALSCRTHGRARPSALDSAAAQSMGVPSSIASARSSTSCSLGRTFHLLGQADECPVRRLARSVWGRFAQHLRKLLVGVAHLDLRNDGFTLLRRQPLKRPLVPFNPLTTDRLFEGGFEALDVDAIQIGGVRLPSLSPQLVSDAIEHRLTQVRL